MRYAKLPLILAASMLTITFVFPSQGTAPAQAQSAPGFQAQWVPVVLQPGTPNDHLVVQSDTCPDGWTATKLYDAYSKEEQDIGRSDLMHTGEEEAAFSDTAPSPTGLRHLCVRADNPAVSMKSTWGTYGCPSGYGFPLVRDDSGTYTNSTEDRLKDLPSLHATNEGSFKGTHNYYVWCLGAEGGGSTTATFEARWASNNSSSPSQVPSCNADEVTLLHSSKRQYNLNYGDFEGTPQQTLCAKLTVAEVSPDAVQASLTANPTVVENGQNSTLTWSSANATSCTGTNFSTNGATSGSLSVTPGSTTSYSVTCTGPNGSANDSASVTVLASGTGISGSCSVSPATIAPGGTATWTASVSGDSGSYTYAWSGTDGLTGSGASVSKTYSTVGTKTASVTITRGSQPQPPSQPGNNPPAQNQQSFLDDAVREVAAAFAPARVARAQDSFCGGEQEGFSVDVFIGGGCGDGGGGGGETPDFSSITIDCSNQLTVANPNPDLVAGAVSPSSATAGQAMTLSATATNIGNAVSGTFPILFQIQSPGTLKNTSYLPGLAPGASVLGSVSHTFGSPGSYQVRACANYNTSWTAITLESNYDNNCGPWSTISVASPPPPPPPLPPGEGPFTCTVSDGAPVPGTSVTYSVTTSNGYDGPFAWDDGEGGSYGDGSSVSRTIPDSGPYGMSVSGGGNAAACSAVIAQCVNASAEIEASSRRVRAGTPVTITWRASGIDTTCTVKGPGIDRTIDATQCVVPDESASPTIQTQSVYRISCDDGEATDEVIVNVIPRFDEF